MIYRTQDSGIVRQATSQVDFELEGFHLREWLADDENVALTNLRGDVSLFERQWRNPSIVTGHYFFFSRGREALDVAKEMLEEIWKEEYKVKTILGLTPVTHRGALWLNKRLGFKTIDTIDAITGPCRLVQLSKETQE